MRSLFCEGYTCGALTAFSVLGLIEDFLGRDRFILFARDHWVSAWISCPIALVGLAITIRICLRVRGQLDA